MNHVTIFMIHVTIYMNHVTKLMIQSNGIDLFRKRRKMANNTDSPQYWPLRKVVGSAPSANRAAQLVDPSTVRPIGARLPDLINLDQ
jgi:hypothetical protein